MLTLVRAHDLPVSWDGVPVTWRPWSDARSTLAYHASDEELACEQCGLIDEPITTSGLRPALDRATRAELRTRHTRSGHPYTVAVDVPTTPVYDLHTFRCRGCGHDTVLDDRTGELWDLEPDDYGPDGSTDTKDTLW